MIGKSTQELFSKKRLQRVNNTNKLVYQYELRDFFNNPHNGKGVINGTKETALSSIALKQLSKESTVLNGYGRLLDFNKSLILTDGQREKIMGSMDLVAPIPTDKSTADQRQAYRDSVTFTTAGSVALDRDEKALDTRNEAAALMLQQHYSKVIAPAAYLMIGKDWTGAKEFDYWTQLQEVQKWMEDIKGTPEEFKRELNELQKEISTAHTIQQLEKNLALVMKLEKLEMTILTKPTFVSMPTNAKDDDNDTIMEDQLIDKPIHDSFPPHLPTYWNAFLLRKTGNDREIAKLRDTIQWAVKKDWSLNKTATKLAQEIADTVLPDPDRPATTVPVIRAAVATTHHGVEEADIPVHDNEWGQNHFNQGFEAAMQQMEEEQHHDQEMQQALQQSLAQQPMVQAFAATSAGAGTKRQYTGQPVQPNRGVAAASLQPPQPMGPPPQPIICQHFLAGNCQYGDKCFKSHDTSNLNVVYMTNEEVQQHQMNRMNQQQRVQQATQQQQQHTGGSLRPMGTFGRK